MLSNVTFKSNSSSTLHVGLELHLIACTLCISLFMSLLPIGVNCANGVSVGREEGPGGAGFSHDKEPSDKPGHGSRIFTIFLSA